MRKYTKRLAVGLASMAVATTAIVAAGETSAYALATCASGHICFFKDYRYLGNGAYTAAGTMSDQTNALFKGARTISGDWGYDNWIQIPTYGNISNFQNSHYTDGEGLDNSVSLVVNNSGECLVMWPASPNRVSGSEPSGRQEIEFGPHTSKAMAGDTLGYDNDQFSSAATVPRNNGLCVNVADGQYTVVG